MNESVKFVLGTLAIVVAIGFFIKPPVKMPPYALVYVDKTTDTYFAPACLTASQKEKMTVSKAKSAPAGVIPNHSCRDQGGFKQEGVSWSMAVVHAVGLGTPPKSRWNEDGTWNW